MTVKDLIAALQALPPETQGAIVSMGFDGWVSVEWDGRLLRRDYRTDGGLLSTYEAEGDEVVLASAGWEPPW